MKKGYLLPLALLGLMYLPSCQQEVEPVTPEDEPVPEGCYFRAYPETPEDESRTYISEKDEYNKQHVIWRVGEKLQVINGTGDVCANFESMDNAQKALFYYEGTDFAMTAPYYSIYPATAGVSLSEGNPVFTYAIPTTQSSLVNTFADGTNVTVGYAGADKRLSMLNLNAYISFEINNKEEELVTKAVLTATGGPLAGTVAQAFTGTPLNTHFGDKSVSSSSNTITLNPPPGNTYFTAGTYYIAFIPGTLSTVTLDLMRGDKLVSHKTRGSALTAERNNVYHLGDVTPSDVASALGRSASIKSVSSLTRRTLVEKVDYIHAVTTLRPTSDGSSFDSDKTVNFHILKVQLSTSPVFDVCCVLPYNAPTPWVSDPDTDAWDTQAILSGGWVDAVNAGDEHVIAMFPCGDYNTTTYVPTGRVHSRGQILRENAAPQNQGEVSVRRAAASIVRGFSFGENYASVYYALPQNYTDLGGYFNRLVSANAIQDPSDWTEDNSDGAHAAIGYVGDNTNANGNYKKAYYIVSDGGYPYNLAELMKELGCYNAAMQHPGAMGEMILENGSNHYEVVGKASEHTAIMTAWALVVKKVITPRYIIGSAYAHGRVDGPGVDARLDVPQGICWSQTANVAYFTQRGSGNQAVRTIDFSTEDNTVATLSTDTNISQTYGCCPYTLNGTDGVLCVNKNKGRPWKLFFVSQNGTFVPICDYDLPSGIVDVKVDAGGNVWVVAMAQSRIIRGHIQNSCTHSPSLADYEFIRDGAFNMTVPDSGHSVHPCCLTFDGNGNALYGTWAGAEDDGLPGIYFIPCGATDESDIVRVAGDGSAASGTDLGTPGDLTTATFPDISGLCVGSDGALYIACGTSTETTNSVRKLIPVNKGTLTADSYKKGRMITLNPNNAATNLIATGIIVNSDCSAAYVTDNNHRILRILINTPSY